MAELLFEIGTEELPARFLKPALNHIITDFDARLTRLGLSAEELEVDGTPRRLVLIGRGLPDRQADRDEQVLGPPARIAFDANGGLTPAGLGFAKKQGVDPDRVERVETAKGEYLAIHKRHIGKPLGELLSVELRELVAGLPFPKSMR
ncbi:MAG: glycine--tRNA ligase subunit beta, partial [Myxococcales bacterium]|nr:glycine--tRNA ligase subunit beta [Myxococcales bacterium]